MNTSTSLQEIKAIVRRLNLTEIKIILMAFCINPNDHWTRHQIVTKLLELVNNSDMFISSTAISLIYKGYYNKVGLTSGVSIVPSISFTTMINNFLPVTPIVPGYQFHALSVPAQHSTFMQTQACAPAITMSKLPLFSYDCTLVAPSTLNVHLEKSPNASKTRGYFSFKLHDKAKIISASRHINNDGSFTYSNHVFLRIGLVNLEASIFTDRHPNDLHVEVNRRLVSFHSYSAFKNNPNYVYDPIEITNQCILTAMSLNHVSISFDSFKNNENFFYCIFIGKKLKSEEVVTFISSKPGFSMKKTLSTMVKQLYRDKDSDILGDDHITVSLRCPVSYCKITTPVRFSECNHVQCFDAKAFIDLMFQMPSWVCPICDTKMSFDQLLIDPLMMNILLQTDLDSETVVIRKDGTFQISQSTDILNRDNDPSRIPGSKKITGKVKKSKKPIRKSTSSSHDTDDDVICLD